MSDDLLDDFLEEAGELLESLGPQLVELEQQPDDPDLLNAVFRAFHTVKGGAGFLNLQPLVNLCHKAEDVFGLVRDGKLAVDPHMMDLAQRSLDVLEDQMAALNNDEEPQEPPPELLQALQDELDGNRKASPAPAEETTASETESTDAKPAETKPAADKPARKPKREQAETSVRVETRRLDALMNLIGELVLVRNRLKTLKEDYRDPPLERAVGELDTITYALQAAVMRTRMQPIGKLFARFPKLTRDLARNLNKEIELELVGQDEDLDKNLVEALADPMVHLVRNAMDHGVEAPDVREKRGKSRVGHVRLSAQQEGDSILIKIQDDGAGMDADVLRRKAVEKELMTADAAANMSDEECYQIIFMPGFSTKAEVSEVSGRGVGMDVVKSRINELNGNIHITSELGQGSCFTLRLPLTLAILPTLMADVNGRAYALPLSCIEEVFELKPKHLRKVEGRDVAWVRDSALPLVSLRKWSAAGSGDELTGHVVVAQTAGDRYGFVVDSVMGREEVVIKPLGHLLKEARGIAGATVTGQGGVALILDLNDVAQSMGVVH